MMSLPHEAEVIADVATKYRSELDAMAGLHDAVAGMMSVDSWTTIGRRGLNHLVIETIVGLLTKACKTFRSIQILCERGLIGDADALVRVLMENTVAIAFILQKKPRERARVYHAHAIAQNIKMLNDWKNTPGLKRKAPKTVIKRANDLLAEWTKGLPVGTDFKHHWSGKRNLREAVKALRGDVMYATLYRFTSSVTHASDFGAHVEIDQGSDDRVWQIEPSAQGFEAPSYAARELFWNAANRIDQRLGLGFASMLAPHKIQKK
jgi:uncharacterized protein DUF5677